MPQSFNANARTTKPLNDRRVSSNHHPITMINPRTRPHIRKRDESAPVNIFRPYRPERPPAA